jgi:hypothetical protein
MKTTKKIKKIKEIKKETWEHPDGTTTCCDAMTTFVEGILCCKKCYEQVQGRL